MSRARYYSRQTAAAYESQGSGCFSAFLLPPLTVMLVGAALAALSFNVNPAANFTQPPGASTSPLSQVFTPEVRFWNSSIQRWAVTMGLDPNLIAVVMQIESCGDPSARSRAGAMGLFQVMPYHFLAADDPYSPETNAVRGMNYLQRSLAAAGNDVRLALAGYNGGIGVIPRAEWTWPAETQRYAYWGSGIFQDASSGAAASPRLDEWLKAGGAGMCRRAASKLGVVP